MVNTQLRPILSIWVCLKIPPPVVDVFIGTAVERTPGSGVTVFVCFGHDLLAEFRLCATRRGSGPRRAGISVHKPDPIPYHAGD
jgi:hypothetical protein